MKNLPLTTCPQLELAGPINPGKRRLNAHDLPSQVGHVLQGQLETQALQSCNADAGAMLVSWWLMVAGSGWLMLGADAG